MIRNGAHVAGTDAYLSRYTHRVAISNSRLIHFDETGVTLRYKVPPPVPELMVLHEAGRLMSAPTGRRVHPPLPAPRPAERLPPYPPLRAARRPLRAARRRHPQGRARPRPPAARRGAARHSRRAGRPARYPSALPMLRRPHGRRRDLRALVPTTRTAARHPPDRDHHVMTRHGPASSPPVAPALPAMMPLAPTTSPSAPPPRSFPDSGQCRCRIQPLNAVLPFAVERPDDYRARLTPRPNPEIP